VQTPKALRTRAMLQNLILITIVLISMMIGVSFSDYAKFLAPLAVYGMMAILFLSFLSIKLDALYTLNKSRVVEIVVWTLNKLLIIPLVMWALALWMIPAWADAVLVLSATSTAATAPFFTARLKGNVVLAIQIVITTSLLTPFVLPSLIRLILDQSIEIPFFDMVELLALLIFLPILAAVLVRKLSPQFTRHLRQKSLIITIIIFSIVITGVFANYSSFLIANKQEVVHSLLIASALTSACILLGIFLGKSAGRHLELTAGVISITYTNDMLAVVFGSQFFGPRIPLLAAMHMLPLFLVLVPLEWLRNSGLNVFSGQEPSIY
jgi:predicted Na+-dependent transporter